MAAHPKLFTAQQKIIFPLALVGLILFITGSFISIDWMNMLKGTTSLYPAFAKPVVSILCAAVALGAWRYKFEPRDFGWVAGTFGCIVIVDICMSIYVYASNPALTGPVFLVGAILSIMAHVLLIIRHGRGFGWLRERGSLLSRIGFPLAFYLPVIFIFLALIPYLWAAGQFWPSLFYALVLTTSMWVAWEAVRHELFPRPNALLLGLGVSSWFVTEIVGVIHNIEIGKVSDIAMNMTWIFYMPAILLLALSAYDWSDRAA